MREIRTSGSEVGGAGNLTGPPYPYNNPGPSARKGARAYRPGREPDAGDPQVRFDERRWETELRPRLRHRASRRKPPATATPLDLQTPRPASTLPVLVLGYIGDTSINRSRNWNAG